MGEVSTKRGGVLYTQGKTIIGGGAKRVRNKLESLHVF